jgi:tetratricopeptide (TPR) repeat protein
MCFSLFDYLLFAQCPDRTTLRARILQLKYSSVPSGQQLNELLPVSLQLEKCPQQNDSVRILLLQRIGALYYNESKFSQAISYTESSINLLQDKSTSYADPAFLVKVYDFLKVYYDSLKLISMKMNAIDSSIHYALMTDAIDDQVLYNIWQRSAYTLDVGDFQRCINYSSLGEALTEEYATPEVKLIYRLNFFTNRISALIGINDLDAAEKDLHKKIVEFTSEGLADECALFYSQLSIIARTQNKYDLAIRYHEKSFKSNKEHGYMLQCKQTMNNIGFLYLNYILDPGKALKYFNEALKYKSAINEELMNDEIETANVLDNTGIAYSRLNMFDSAYFYFQKAFDILGKGTDENSLVNMPLDKFIRNPKLHYVTSLILEKGIAYAKQFEVTGEVQYLDESLRIFKIADKVLTKIKTAQAELQSRLAWRRNTRILYEKAINTCQIANRPHEAFYFFERSRAVLLNDQIYQNRSMSSNDINTKAQLERKLEMLNTQLKTTPPGAADYAALQKNILFLTQQKDRIVFQKRQKRFN